MKQNTLLVLVIALGILARIVLWSMVPVTGDAVYHYSISRYISDNWRIPSFEWQTGGDPMWYPPAFHVLASLFHTITGSEKTTPLFVSILSLFAFYALLKKFYPNHLFPGMVLAAFLPTQLYYGAIGYVDSLFFLLAPLIFYYYFSYLEKKDIKFLAVTLLLSTASFLTHYHGFIPLLAVTIHLFFKNHGRSLVRDKKLALIFIVAGLLLVSPWYIRNYVVFGNPVWPLLFDGKYPVHEGYRASKIVNILDPGKWGSLFFEYWVGAPNSGEDFMRNVEVAGEYIPYVGLFFTAWLLFVVILSLMTLYGLVKLLKTDKNKLLFLTFILLSVIPLMLSNFVRMLAFVFPILILALSHSLVSLSSKMKLTGVFFNLALKFSPTASRVNSIFSASKRVLALVVFILLVSVPFAYAFVYGSLVEKYGPFYSMASEKLPEDAVVCNMMDDVFFNKVDRRIVSIGSILEYRVTLECLDDSVDKIECFKKHNIGYVCCTSLRTLNIGGTLRESCDKLNEKSPLFQYTSGGVWGRCWKVNGK